MSSVYVREVDGIEDHETITDLAAIIMPDDDRPNTSVGDWWLAFVDDVAVGFAGMRDATTEPDASFLCLAGVVPQARGRGLQRRLIHARVAKARRLGKLAVVTYTVLWNCASSNNLIRCGFRHYMPKLRFEGGDVCYWRRDLAPSRRLSVLQPRQRAQ